MSKNKSKYSGLYPTQNPTTPKVESGAEHTPLPWSRSEAIAVTPSMRAWILRADDIHLGSPICIIPLGVGGKANSSFICRAVNNHEALLEALKITLRVIEYSELDGDAFEDEVKIIRQAISNATEKED